MIEKSKLYTREELEQLGFEYYMPIFSGNYEVFTKDGWNYAFGVTNDGLYFDNKLGMRK